jgi:hypothetical protein
MAIDCLVEVKAALTHPNTVPCPCLTQIKSENKVAVLDADGTFTEVSDMAAEVPQKTWFLDFTFVGESADLAVAGFPEAVAKYIGIKPLVKSFMSELLTDLRNEQERRQKILEESEDDVPLAGFRFVFALGAVEVEDGVDINYLGKLNLKALDVAGG